MIHRPRAALKPRRLAKVILKRDESGKSLAGEKSSTIVDAFFTGELKMRRKRFTS